MSPYHLITVPPIKIPHIPRGGHHAFSPARTSPPPPPPPPKKHKVLLSHFKARNPTRRTSHSSKANKSKGNTNPADNKHTTTGATNIERIRHELASARMRDDSNAHQKSETSIASSSFGGGVSPFRNKRGAGRDNIVKPKAPAKARPSAHTGWRGFDIAETRGIVYQTRVGQLHNR